MQLRLPAASDEIPHPIRIAQSFAGSARTKRVGPDDDGDWLAMARDRDLFASVDALKDLREGRSSLADGHRVRHSVMVHHCTVLHNERTRTAPQEAS
jgi:hypothetical protein